jgi:Ni/Fe-hydrogenase subunit HybB-like protein
MAELAKAELLNIIREECNPPMLEGNMSYHDITDQISSITEWKKTPTAWWIMISITGTLLLLLLSMLTYLVSRGIGVWGNNSPAGWAWDITNFVWWIGIGHAGTLISAILFLLRQKWRTAINRAAEAMTIFAVACAAIFPLFHTGRPWRAIYWLFPIPNTYLHMWQNYRSPLEWDVFAVSTYGTVSVLFWYTGLIPDLAILRDRSKPGLRKVIYGVLSLGWRGAANHWKHYEKAYMILAGISTPLVLSVHTIVSFDFAVSVIPGWHTTIFPPYFVGGAVFSGFAMVMTLLLITRWLLHLENIITMRHLELMNKVILATGTLVGYSYATEFYIAWYSGDPYEQFGFLNRIVGPYWWAWWTMFICNCVIPQFFWVKKMRRNIAVMFIISITTNIGMWFERFVIIVLSLHRDFLPSSWGYFKPTWVDICTYIGTFGLFLTLYLLFVKFCPIIAVAEVKGTLSNQTHTDHVYAHYLESHEVSAQESHGIV